MTRPAGSLRERLEDAHRNETVATQAREAYWYAQWRKLAEDAVEAYDQCQAERDAARAELAGIDATLAGRPALDKPTRRGNIEHACAENQRLADSLADVRAERDAARAEVARLREALLVAKAEIAIYCDAAVVFDAYARIDAALAAKEGA